MGACFSRIKGGGPPPPATAGTCVDGRKGLPPEAEALQEETVKEVLSETPKPKLKVPSSPREEEARNEKEGGKGLVLAADGRDDRSEVTSDVCSVSESLSVSTALTEVTIEERQPSAPPVKFQRKRSSSSSDILLKRERTSSSVASAGCSGRSSPSQTKRREGVPRRTSSVREASTAAKSRGGGAVGNALGRDPGERSGRRSVSPAAKRASAGQCRSASTTRANGLSSPQRVAGGGALEGGRFGGSRRRLAQDPLEGRGREGSLAGPGGKETLENPLVSLECFIFL